MRGRISASFFALILSVLGARPAAGQSIDDQRRALASAQAQVERAARMARSLQASAKAEAGAAKIIEARSIVLAGHIQQMEAEIAAEQARLLLVEKLYEDVRARLAERQRPAMRLMAAVQSYARRPAVLSLVQPGTVWDLVHVQLILTQIGPELRKRTSSLQAELLQKESLEAESRRALDTLKKKKARLREAQLALIQLEARHRVTSQQLSQAALTAQDKALAMGEQARDIVELIDQLGDASVRQSQLAMLPGPVLRPAQPETAAAPAALALSKIPNQLPYRLPVTGRLVTGLGEAAASGVRAKGLVFATLPGAQVIAPRRGQIVFAGPFRGYGQIVIIDHGSGWTSLITNMANLSVRVGDLVRDSAPIGRAGQGRPRVVVELRRAGQPVDITRLVS